MRAQREYAQFPTGHLDHLVGHVTSDGRMKWTMCGKRFETSGLMPIHGTICPACLRAEKRADV